MSNSVLIENLTKSFDGNVVLDRFTSRLAGGQIHMLVGQNGSGKSTLIKVLSGYHPPDPGGAVTVGEVPLGFGSPESSYRIGCRFVHQDLGLLPTLSVLDNLALGPGYPTTLGTIRTNAAKRAFADSLRDLRLRIDPMTKVLNLSAAERTGVAIARALRPDSSHPARLLVLDEPTASLPAGDVDRLLTILRTAAERGLCVVFVTHHIDEVFRIGDSVTVMRDGRLVLHKQVCEVNRSELVESLAGRTVDRVRRRAERVPAAHPQPALSVERLVSDQLRSVSLDVAAGEIVGVAGLTGSGREVLLGAIFGAVPAESGRVSVDARSVRLSRPDVSIRAGMAFLPADRKRLGGTMSLSARQNLTLPWLSPFWRRLHLCEAREREDARQWLTQMQVRPVAPENPLHTFSGGNQQKLLLGRWLRIKPRVLLLDEPTQGVDVNGKTEVHRHIFAAAEAGMAVFISSTDDDELAKLCDRILVLRRGSIAGQLQAGAINQSALARALAGEVSDGESMGTADQP